MDGTKRGAQAPDRDRSNVPGSTSREFTPLSHTQCDVVRAHGHVRPRGIDVRAACVNSGPREREIMIHFNDTSGIVLVGCTFLTEVR